MHVDVDQQRCQGHTLCALTAPELFGLRDDDGHAFARRSEVVGADEDRARRAASSCPEQAIELRK